MHRLDGECNQKLRQLVALLQFLSAISNTVQYPKLGITQPWPTEATKTLSSLGNSNLKT